METEALQSMVLTQVDNFFIEKVAPDEYKQSIQALSEASKPPKKKVYRNLKKMLKECYFVGSLKYGNNFIA